MNAERALKELAVAVGASTRGTPGDLAQAILDRYRRAITQVPVATSPATSTDFIFRGFDEIMNGYTRQVDGYSKGPYRLERMGPGEYGFFVNGVCETITPTLPQLLEAVVDGVRVREIIGFDAVPTFEDVPNVFAEAEALFRRKLKDSTESSR